MPDATPARDRGRMPWTVVLGAILMTAAFSGAAHATRIAATPRADALSRTSWMEADRNAVGPIGRVPPRMVRERSRSSAERAWYQLDPGASAVPASIEVGVVMVMTRRGTDRAGGLPRDAWSASLTGGSSAASEYPRLVGSDTLCTVVTVTPGQPFVVNAEINRTRLVPGGAPVGLAPTVRTYFCGLPEGMRVVPAKAPRPKTSWSPWKALYR